MTYHISREAVEQIIAAQCGECADACLEFDGIQPDCNQCLLGGAAKAIKSITAADVRPVRRGRWIQTTQPMGCRDEDCAECSVCGEDFVLDEWAMDEFTNLMNFCPNCGADMREEI